MNNSSLDISLINSFQQNFEFCTLSYKKVEIKNTQSSIHSFFVSISNQSILESEWRAISNFIALYFQNKLESEFERWNLYIFYLTATEISNELKYKIENDTFSSRKIVVENEDDLTKIISEHILNDDLRINKSLQVVGQEDTIEKNQLLWKILRNQDATQKVGNESKNSFAEIVENLKNQNNEI